MTTVAKRPVILSQFKLSTTGSLANIVSAENQSSSIMLHNLIFYYLNTAHYALSTTTVTATVARI